MLAEAWNGEVFAECRMVDHSVSYQEKENTFSHSYGVLETPLVYLHKYKIIIVIEDFAKCFGHQ